MTNQYVFKRYERKYMLTDSQAERLAMVMESHVTPDQYGVTTVRNLYFDTPNHRLIRRSMEKPVYKEKLRIRSYCPSSGAMPVFVELKKKYEDVVYKRRLELPYEQALDWLCQRQACSTDGQIAREIDYFAGFYRDLQPKMFLSYERQAWYGKENQDLRLTIDRNILASQNDLSMDAPLDGMPLLPPGQVLLEIKTMGGMPLWLTRFLTQEKIYKTSFSKYGKAYEMLIYNGGTEYVGNIVSGTI